MAGTLPLAHEHSQASTIISRYWLLLSCLGGDPRCSTILTGGPSVRRVEGQQQEQKQEQEQKQNQKQEQTTAVCLHEEFSVNMMIEEHTDRNNADKTAKSFNEFSPILVLLTGPLVDVKKVKGTTFAREVSAVFPTIDVVIRSEQLRGWRPNQVDL
eukprot:779145-Amphidinium_carterae.1